MPRRIGPVMLLPVVVAITLAAVGAAPRPSSGPCPADDDAFLLKGGEGIVFFGDSITQNGGYVNYFESYLLTRFPHTQFRVVNHGISSETISGTTEEDHDPPRPWALPRFERDIAAWKPDVVVACFGMNDGNYYPFEPVRFRKYQQGIGTLIRRTHDEAKARLILMTPPPFDPYRRRASDPQAVTFGYKFPAIDYDDTLARYSQWLVTLRDDGQTVVDLHSAMNKHLKQRRREQVSFHLSPDAVHPNATGHWLMAQHLLLEMNAPPVAADVTIDWDKQKVTGASVKQFRVYKTDLGTGMSFTWSSPIPLPLDPAWDRQSILQERVAERLNRYRLRVTGLKDRDFGYLLRIDEKFVAAFPAKRLKAGINLAQFPPVEGVPSAEPRLARLADLPTNVAARELLSLVKQRRRLVYSAWRAEIAEKSSNPNTESRVKALTARIEELRKPRDMKVQIEPFPGI